MKLNLVRALSIRYADNREAVGWDHSAPLTSVGDLKALASKFLRHETQEVMGVMCLDHHAHLIGWAEVYRGTAHSVTCSPREIAKIALLSNAFAIVLVHNHPGEYGVPMVSDEDIHATRNVLNAMVPLAVTVQDHIVVGADDCESIMVAPGPRTKAATRRILFPPTSPNVLDELAEAILKGIG